MDFSQIESVLGLASTALGATGKAVSTVEAVRSLFSAGKAPDNEEAKKLLSGLATELTAANMMNVQLSEALRVLSRELKRQDEFETEKARYQVVQTQVGDVVLRLKEDMAYGQPVHFICPVCLNRDKLISYLATRGDYKTCQADNAHVFAFARSDYRSVIGVEDL